MKLKLKVLNEYDVAFPLMNPDNIIVKFPYHMGYLEKSLAYNQVKIIDQKHGEIEVELSDFEIDGIPEGQNQDFYMTIFRGIKKYEALFSRCLNVTFKDGKKILGGV